MTAALKVRQSAVHSDQHLAVSTGHLMVVSMAASRALQWAELRDAWTAEWRELLWVANSALCLAVCWVCHWAG